MKRTGEEGHKKAEVISFDIASLPKHELQDLFKDLPVKSLRQWLNYYAEREQYEVCSVIRDNINRKAA